MKDMTVGRRRVVASMIAAMAALTLLPASPAAAGDATIYQCRTPFGQADTDLLSSSGSAAIVLSLSDCAGDGAWLLSAGAAGDAMQDAHRTLNVTAPGTTSFVGGTVHRSMTNYAYVNIDNPDRADTWGFGYKLETATGEVIERCGHNDGPPSLGDCGPARAAIGPGTYTAFNASSKALPTTSNAAFRLDVGCIFKDPGRCYHHFANPGINHLSFALRVRDGDAPRDVEAVGPLATADPIRGGDGEISVAASDPGGLGVYETEFLVDDKVLERHPFSASGGACVDVDPSNDDRYEFRSGHPCPQSAPSETFRPDVPEGKHNLKVRVTDAAGNATIALNRTVVVDRIPPPSNVRLPEVAGAAEQGRSLAADPGLWDAHGAAAPTYGVQWQRCAGDGSGCADIPGATQSLYDLSADDVGRRLRVRVTATNSEGATAEYSHTTPVVARAAWATDPVATRPDPEVGASKPEGPTGAVPALDSHHVGVPSLGTDLRPPGTANGENATADAKLTAHDAATERRTVRTRYGRSVTIAGRILTPAGHPISGARLEVHEQEARAGAPSIKRGELLSAADGAFRYLLPPGSSRTVRIGYRARVGDVTFARTTDVRVQVVAGVRFTLSRTSLRNGQNLRYTGRILGPSTGHRFVEVQVRNGRRWQIVCSVRTDARGAFGCAHRFRRTHSPVTYVFRARVRQQPGLPYEPGTSGARKARVRP